MWQTEQPPTIDVDDSFFRLQFVGCCRQAALVVSRSHVAPALSIQLFSFFVVKVFVVCDTPLQRPLHPPDQGVVPSAVRGCVWDATVQPGSSPRVGPPGLSEGRHGRHGVANQFWMNTPLVLMFYNLESVTHPSPVISKQRRCARGRARPI